MKKGSRAAFTLNLSDDAAQGLHISRRRTIATVNIRVYVCACRIGISGNNNYHYYKNGMEWNVI